jgi:hypothetical protein
MVMHVMD